MYTTHDEFVRCWWMGFSAVYGDLLLYNVLLWCCSTGCVGRCVWVGESVRRCVHGLVFFSCFLFPAISAPRWHSSTYDIIECIIQLLKVLSYLPVFPPKNVSTYSPSATKKYPVLNYPSVWYHSWFLGRTIYFVLSAVVLYTNTAESRKSFVLPGFTLPFSFFFKNQGNFPIFCCFCSESRQRSKHGIVKGVVATWVGWYLSFKVSNTV